MATAKNKRRIGEANTAHRLHELKRGAIWLEFGSAREKMIHLMGVRGGAIFAQNAELIGLDVGAWLERLDGEIKALEGTDGPT